MWARFFNILLGLWLIVSPALLDMSETASNTFRIVGPLVISFATIAIWEATREVRWANVPLGAWLLVAPWLFGYGTAALITSLLVGVLLIAFALVRGEVESEFGGGWSALF